MKPLSKMFGWIGAVGALVAAVKVGLATGDWTTLGAALGAVIALFSHSATGSGGQPTVPSESGLTTNVTTR